MYESKHKPLLSRAAFAKRLGAHMLVAFGLVVVSLGVGMWGYIATEHLSALDAFLNAAMLLGGMGPVATLATSGGKLFAGMYALYAGLVFVVSAALISTPILHRLLHRFHMMDEDG